MSTPGGAGPTWWERHVWDRDDAAMGLPAAYQPIRRLFLSRPACWFGRHLQGPCGVCARGCGFDPDSVRGSGRRTRSLLLGGSLFGDWGGWKNRSVDDPLWGLGFWRRLSWRWTAARLAVGSPRCRLGVHDFRNPFPGTAFKASWCNRCGRPGVA